MFENTVIKEKFICKNHDDSLINHFEVEKTLKLIQKNIIESFARSRLNNILNSVIYVNVRKHRDIDYMMSLNFCLFQQNYKRKYL